FRDSILEGDVPAFDITELAQSLPKPVSCVVVVVEPGPSDDRHRLLLRPSGDRHERRAEQRKKIAPVHSMTSSARCSSDCGTARPSAFAVFRLMTSSKTVGCRTGRSAGLAPLRICAA